MSDEKQQQKNTETSQDMVESAMKKVPSISCKEYVALRDTDQKYVLLDVREESEWEAGHIDEAKHIPRGVLEFKITDLVPDTSTTLILCCRSGGRSALAAQTLTRLGYEDVRFLEGGYSGYCEQYEEKT